MSMEKTHVAAFCGKEDLRDLSTRMAAQLNGSYLFLIQNFCRSFSFFKVH